MISRRAAVAAGVVALWLAGLAALTRREFFRDDTERLAAAALLVEPGAEYYTITREGARVGWASSTIDTLVEGISVKDVIVADLPGPRGVRHMAVRSHVELTRGMALRSFTVELGGDYGPYVVRGRLGDDTLTLITVANRARPDTSHVPVHGTLLLPSTVPLALALEQRPHIGGRYSYTMYDPMSGTPEPVTVRVRAESLFVLSDSASFDATAERWVAAHQDTVRGWLLEQQGGGLLSGWVDEQGRPVEATPLGKFTLRRTAYEMAFENWQLETRGASAAAPHP